MPELPEVESLKKSLLPYILNQKILKAKVLNQKIVSGKGNKRQSVELKTSLFENGLKDQKIISLERKAKNLILKLENESLILIHLKMTGQLVFKPNNNLLKNSKNTQNLIFGGHPIQLSDSQLPNKHTCLIFELENGKLFYNDVRQFGYLLFYANLVEFEKENHFVKLGLEPLEENFKLQKFSQTLKNQNGILKKVFLEQKAVVGLGNIYADEVCFDAKILPNKSIKSLTKKEIENLYNSIKLILKKAVDLGGSSVANYLLADGSRGNFAREHKVYKRGNKDCLVCGNILQKTRIAGRATVFCRICQK
jgi:formamidopyrimidine-DNA glycosylase